MNTELINVFTDSSSEYTNLQSSSPDIDLTDSPCSGTPTTGVCGALNVSPNFLTTAQLAQTGYYELEFNMAYNSYWGCSFQYGNSACGIQIRQGIAHMFDKNAFCSNSVVAGVCTSIDNPLPTTSAGGLPSPNPCGYDTIRNRAGSQCVVGAPGGVAYHINAATGADGYAWLYSPGSTDLNLAAQHFVNAGVASGYNSATSVLTSPVSTNAPNLFIRSDDPARLQLGQSLAAEICYLFTGSYTEPCSPYLTTIVGTASVAFQCIGTTCCPPGSCWWMYIAAFSGPTYFDGSLYSAYNSRFVDAACASPGTSSCTTQKVGGGYCSNQSVDTSSPTNYMYICNSTFDSLTDQMEFSPCLTATGDPTPGSATNGPGGDCPGTTQLSAISAGVQAEAVFGAIAFTIPLFEKTVEYGLLNNGWNTGIVNDAMTGLPNYFTWLNGWNSAPVLPGTIRQGFAETTRSVSPFIASSAWDTYIVSEVYDSLFSTNPLNPAQIFNWMTLCFTPGGGCTAVSYNNATVVSTEGYTPPPSTVLTYHFTLNPALYFQDGRQVTAYDVAFSYLSLVGSGAFISSVASTMTGITVLGPRTFDISVSSVGPFELPNITSLPILSGRYWTGAGSSAWDPAIAACTGALPCPKSQYALSGASVYCPSALTQPGCSGPAPGASLMQVDPSKVTVTYDPIANHVLVGSGPWECGPVGSSGSGPCSTTGTQNPPTGDSYTLTRFGCTSATSCLAPASSTSGIYFRSSGDLALYQWTQENDLSPLIPLSAVGICINQALGTGACAHWQQGIGANTATGTTGCTSSQAGCVTVTQFSEVLLRFGLNWIAPYEWATSPPMGIVPTPPTLNEGTVTLTPCPSGGTSPAGSTTGYNC